MKKHYLHLMLLWIFTGGALLAQPRGQWGISLNGAYSLPMGSLSDWFKPAGNFSLAIGQQYNDRWFVEGLLEYSRYDAENLSGYADGRVDLFLEHTALWASGRLHFASGSTLRPYFHLAGGVLYWKGRRGDIQADDSIFPAVPFIPARTLEEFNWGARAGIGTEIAFTSRFSVDAMVNYRFIVGELWPTLQQNIELDGVSGFQSLNLSLGLRYYF